MTLPTPPLLLVTDRNQAIRPLIDVIEAAFVGGCRWVSLREKDLPGAEQIALARALMPLATKYDARLTIHGGARLAYEAATDGVHLSAGADASAARAMLGPHALIGISIHSSNESQSLDIKAVDYAVAGPIYLSKSKPGYGPALGTGIFNAMMRSTPVPVVPIGGISKAQAVTIARAGAVALAVMGEVMRSRAPEQTVRDLLHAFQTAKKKERSLDDQDRFC